MMAHAQKPDLVFRAKRTSPFKSARGASVQSTTCSRGVRISGSNAGYTMFRGSVKGTGYTLHSPVSPSRPHPCVAVCHHISTGLYLLMSFCPSARITAGPSGRISLKICYWVNFNEDWSTDCQIWFKSVRNIRQFTGRPNRVSVLLAT